MFNVVIDKKISETCQSYAIEKTEKYYLADIDEGMSHISYKFCYLTGLMRGLKISAKGFWGRACARENIKRKKMEEILKEINDDLSEDEYTTIDKDSDFHNRIIQVLK